MEDLPGPDKSKISFLERPTMRDLWDLKGAILELMVVTALFFASLGNGDMRSILMLSIFVTVLACLLIIADIYDMRKKRDFRRIKLALLGLDAVVLIASGVVLHYWILNTDDVIGDEHVPTLFALDGLMLISMIVIVLARLFLRARDRRIEEAESGILMRNTTNNSASRVV